MRISAATQAPWRILPFGDPPRMRLPESEGDRSPVLRLVRSDGRMGIFAESFLVPPGITHAYFWGNINARVQAPSLPFAPDPRGERQTRMR